jgi:hypothetical protein
MVDTTTNNTKRKYYYNDSLSTIEERYQYLVEVPDQSKLPLDAYRFNPPGIAIKISFLMFQRRIVYSFVKSTFKD